MIYGYIRVSTDRQTVENQRYEIQCFCERHGMRIDRWIEETISGTIPWEKRALGKLLRRAKGDDLLLCSELSRLGRSLFMILDVLNQCMRRKVQVWTIKDNYRLGDDISSKVLAFALGLSAEIERNLISQRTKEALARRRALGKRLGRPRGATTPSKLQAQEEVIRHYMKRGFTISKIARKLHVSRKTLIRQLISMQLIPEERPITFRLRRKHPPRPNYRDLLSKCLTLATSKQKLLPAPTPRPPHATENRITNNHLCYTTVTLRRINEV